MVEQCLRPHASFTLGQMVRATEVPTIPFHLPTPNISMIIIILTQLLLLVLLKTEGMPSIMSGHVNARAPSQIPNAKTERLPP